MRTRILLADDHPLVRRGIRQVLAREPDLEVVAEASDGAEAVERALAEEVDLAILDVAMPRLTGLQAAAELAKRRPETKVLMLSMYDNEQYLFAAIRAGAAGYVLKSVVDEDIVDACRAAIAGAPFVCPPVASALVHEYLRRAEAGEEPPRELLTPRETEVLKLVAEGLSSQRIAETLVISVKTVEHHRGRILEKLGLRSRVELTRYAIRRGLVEP